MSITFLPLYFAPLLLVLYGLILIIGIDSLIKINKLWKLKQITTKELIIGLIISVTLYGLVKLIYQGEKEAFSMIFVGPFFMIFLPYIIHFVAHSIKKTNYISKIFLIGISFTMVGMVLKVIINSIS